mmetsp:Transcript_87898/g.200849  ORF Transcript_87898/g.200849 Transcript_87898/m.200849 type:complete len:284 (+) Transcript_87898:197-1048(+)
MSGTRSRARRQQRPPEPLRCGTPTPRTTSWTPWRSRCPTAPTDTGVLSVRGSCRLRRRSSSIFPLQVTSRLWQRRSARPSPPWVPPPSLPPSALPTGTNLSWTPGLPPLPAVLTVSGVCCARSSCRRRLRWSRTSGPGATRRRWAKRGVRQSATGSPPCAPNPAWPSPRPRPTTPPRSPASPRRRTPAASGKTITATHPPARTTAPASLRTRVWSRVVSRWCISPMAGRYLCKTSPTGLEILPRGCMSSPASSTPCCGRWGTGYTGGFSIGWMWSAVVLLQSP